MVDDLIIRPMRGDDVAGAERLSSEAFLAVDRASRRPHWPEPTPRDPTGAERWRRRTTGFLETDPAGCWVAEDGAGLAGFATSLRRDGTWILATFAVRGELQGRGVGRRLLETALEYSRGCLRGMLSSSADPRAVRRYVIAGFDLHPQMFLRGRLDRSALPVVDGVREGTAADADLADSVDRATRGSGHGPDHAHLVETCRMLVCETHHGTGYAYVSGSGPALLAATDRRTAVALLWTALADGPPEPVVGHVTGANAWAVEVGVAARLGVEQEGYLGVRGMRPPAPYLHHGALL